jgi:HPt (histidine-containing phosphotransfer) domain-containing protein
VADVLDQRVLDDLLASVGGDRAFLAELIDELLDDAPRQLATLRAAVTAGDAESARRAAHTLKGNARTFGAAELASPCQEAEAAAAEGDLDAVRLRLDDIDAAWDHVRAELTAVRDGAA